jgi:sugar phosphate permease
MHRAVVPVATMLAIQVMISLSVLALSVMMPAVAIDLRIDPKLVGIFTAIIYGVAAVTALAAAEPIVRQGAVRICQAALLMAAIGLALNAMAMVAATVLAVMFIGAAQGPINPASAHVLAQRVPRAWFGMVFSLKQTGVPIGFALASLVFPLLLELVGWRAPASSWRVPRCWPLSLSSCCGPASTPWSPRASPRPAFGAPSALSLRIARCACSASRP